MDGIRGSLGCSFTVSSTFADPLAAASLRRFGRCRVTKIVRAAHSLRGASRRLLFAQKSCALSRVEAGAIPHIWSRNHLVK